MMMSMIIMIMIVQQGKSSLKLLRLPRCNSVEHMQEAFACGAEAALAASIFHDNLVPIPDAKRQLIQRDVPLRSSSAKTETTSLQVPPLLDQRRPISLKKMHVQMIIQAVDIFI